MMCASPRSDNAAARSILSSPETMVTAEEQSEAQQRSAAEVHEKDVIRRKSLGEFDPPEPPPPAAIAAAAPKPAQPAGLGSATGPKVLTQLMIDKRKAAMKTRLRQVGC